MSSSSLPNIDKSPKTSHSLKNDSLGEKQAISPAKFATPHLLNPLLDAIFNNHNPQKAPIKSVVEVLGKYHNDFVLIIPSTAVLQTHLDPSSENSSTKTRLYELCYHSEDFIKSHILRTSQPLISKNSNSNASGRSIGKSGSRYNSIIYNTLNGKQIMIKNGQLFPGKGFARALTLKIIKLDYFYSTSSYFPSGSRFMLMHVDSTVIGNYLPMDFSFDQWKMGIACLGVPTTCNIHQRHSSNGKSKVLTIDEQIDNLNSNNDPNWNSTAPNTITFETLLRNYPPLSKVVSDKFFKLLHHNNYNYQILRQGSVNNLDDIDKEFYEILQEAYTIVSKSIEGDSAEAQTAYNIIHDVLSVHRGLDLNKLIHEYIELSLYDKVWLHILNQFKSTSNLTRQNYDKLAHLSLNQLDIPIHEPWFLNDLHKRIYRAIQEFQKLNDSSLMSSQQKTKIITDTVKELITKDNSSNSYNIVIDADTLIGLLIMVVVHAGTCNIEAQLHYIKKFNSINIQNDGYLNYIVSNLDAVIAHLGTSELDVLINHSKENEIFWNLIQHGTLSELRQYLKLFDSQKVTNTFKSRNIFGESCLMLSIKAKSFEKFKLLLEFNKEWITIDDILFDKNITTNHSLLTFSVIEEQRLITEYLIEVLKANATVEEQIEYMNQPDIYGRTIGHYLHHNIDLIDVIGDLIDWELKDLSSQSPLFCLCRCYDHPRYGELIGKAFNCVKSKYGDLVNYDNHIDKNGNTLLHVVQRELTKTGLLEEPHKNGIDVNQFNAKGLTPMSLYVKYNRVQNISDILKDPRLEFNIEDHVHFLNVFDFLNSNKSEEDYIKINNLLTEEFFKLEEIDISTLDRDGKNSSMIHKILSTNAKYDSNKNDWIFYFKEFDSENYEKDKSVKSFGLTTESLGQCLYIGKLQYFVSILPSKEDFFLNFPLNQVVFPSFIKFRVNRFIEDVNIFIKSLNLHPKYSAESLVWEIITRHERQKSTLELIRTIKKSAETVKDNLGEVKLGMLNIQEIEFFLNFSMNDLIKFRAFILRFNKNMVMLDWKLADLSLVYELFLEKLHLNPRNEILEHKNLSAYGLLFKYTHILESSVNRLISNITNCITKLDNWKQIHEQILECNSELKRHESFNNSRTSDTNEDDTVASFFNFSSLIENKQTRYKRLETTKKEEVAKLMNLNIQIKIEHEQLASEISSFLKFKSDFLTFALKIFAKKRVRECTQKVSELSMHLVNIKRVLG